jgi:tetratricopeptide (TPR) repeat protein
MKLIAEKDPPSPRTINPDIPRDLETIILTALAREPHARYASAGELAEDLQAFLDDRPIKARRSTWVHRGMRWCRRNPAMAGLAAATLAALVIGSAIGWIGYAESRTAYRAEVLARRAEAEKRAEAVAASEKADAALHKLEANLQLSLEAFEKVFEAVGGDEVRPGQGPRPDGPPTGEAAEKAAVLEAVLGFYDKFADQNVTDPRLRLEAAKAHRRVGELHRRLGRVEKAVAAARRAAAILDGLVAEYPADNFMRYELCLVYAHSPESAGWTEDQLRAGIEFGNGGNGPVAKWSIGAIQYRLGRLLEGRGDQSGAEEAYHDAIVRLTGERGPGLPPQLVVERALACQRLAGFAIAAGDWRAARQQLESAERDLWPLGGPGGPPNRGARELLVKISTQLASVLDKLGDRLAADRKRGQVDHLRNEPFDDRPPPKGPSPPPKQGGPKDFPPPPKR